MRERQSLRVTATATAVVLGAGRTASIGRNPDQDIVLDDARVSRRHARITSHDGGWVVEDAGSRNGLFVGGERVDRVVVDQVPVTVHVGGVDGPAVVLTPEPPAPLPPAVGQAAAMARTGVLRIGRDRDGNDLVLDDLLVSRHHAELRWAEGGGATVLDLGSYNGTFVNGRRVHRATVGQGDIVGIGQATFRLGPSGLEHRDIAGAATFIARGLSVRSPAGDVLLDDVSFGVGASCLLAVVGPSGAGKSTLLNALAGFRPADTGSVEYAGQDLYNEYDDVRRRIGFVPQDDILHGQLSVSRALSFAAKLRFPPDVTSSERDARVTEVTGELGLSARANLQIRKLSGGQRKRTSVALELLTKPSLLFLDEPTSGLDPGYERSVMQLLRRLADDGRTVIVVTHSVDSLHLCDRVLVMAPGGRPAFFGPPQQAPAFFGQEDFQGVFQELTDGTVDWPARFRASDEHERYVESACTASRAGDTRAGAPAAPAAGGLRQFGTLVRRYAAVLASDRVNLALLLGQAPVLGLLMLLILSRHELALPATGEVRLFSRAAILLFDLVQAATWLGMSNAVRELVKERPIFRRERSVGLSVPAYLLSKVVVLGTVIVVQAAVLVALTTLGQGGPRSALVLGWPLGELMVVMAVTGLSAMALGLVVSALVGSENMAMTLLPVVLIVQNVLSLGGVFPNALNKPVLDQLQYASSSQWGFSAAAATVDLNRLQGLTDVLEQVHSVDVRDPTAAIGHLDLRHAGERRFAHTPATWWRDMAALLALLVGALLAAGVALTRLDPSLAR